MENATTRAFAEASVYLVRTVMIVGRFPTMTIRMCQSRAGSSSQAPSRCRLNLGNEVNVVCRNKSSTLAKNDLCNYAASTQGNEENFVSLAWFNGNDAEACCPQGAEM